MAKGGARARSGPAPDPAALRRDRPSDPDWVELPAEGRVGDPPPWPLSGADGRELELWAEHWRRPQAVEWERLGMGYEVALYVRRFSEAEQQGSVVALSTLVRQMQDALGLSVPGMRSNRWKVVEVVDAEEETTAEEASSARNRFRVVEGG